MDPHPHRPSGGRGRGGAEKQKERKVSYCNYRRMCNPSEMKEYTMAEVAEHNTAEDCWLVIGSDATGERDEKREKLDTRHRQCVGPRLEDLHEQPTAKTRKVGRPLAWPHVEARLLGISLIHPNRLV